jgi:serine/threonine-protein kinase
MLGRMSGDERFVVEGGGLRSVSEKASTLEPLEKTVPLDGQAEAESGRHEAAIGAKLGPYRIVEMLGAGGMGRVFRATHEALGHSVAVKFLRTSAATSRDALDKFFFEAKAAANLEHDSIVRAIDFVADSTFGPYIVMEYVSGRALADVIGRQPMSSARTARIAAKVARALALAHQAGIIHRDVKPANVIVDESAGDRVKVTDFGIAKAMSSLGTEGGTMMGSPHYMAPEQWEGRAADPRTDVFALGVVLYEMLTGRPPFGGSLREISSGLRGVDKPDPRALVSTVPASFAEIVARCMQQQPAARFPTMTDLADALDVAALELAPPATSRSAPSTERRRPRWLWGAAVVVVVAAALAVSFTRGARSKGSPAEAAPSVATAAPVVTVAAAPASAAPSATPIGEATAAMSAPLSAPRPTAKPVAPKRLTPTDPEPDLLRAPTTKATANRTSTSHPSGNDDEVLRGH